MAKLSGNGIPTKELVGSIGDIYTDLNTGRKYKCVEATTKKTYKTTTVSYQWDFIEEYEPYIEDSANSSSVTIYYCAYGDDNLYKDRELTEVVTNEDVIKDIFTKQLIVAEIRDNSTLVLNALDSYNEQSDRNSLMFTNSKYFHFYK